jgi:hypothetical protein
MIGEVEEEANDDPDQVEEPQSKLHINKERQSRAFVNY